MNMRRCPHCGDMIGQDEVICPFCDSPLDEGIAREVRAESRKKKK